LPHLKDILIQFAIIIIPVFLYEMLWLSRYHSTSPKQNRLLVGLLSLFNIFICLMYPVQVSKYFGISFSILLLFSAFLYGGRLIGFIVLLSKGAFIYVLYGIHALKLFPIELIACILPFLIAPKWVSYSKRKKLVLSLIMPTIHHLAIIGIIYFRTIFTGFNYIRNYETILSLIIVLTIMTFTMLFHVYLREFLFENAVIRVQMQKSEKLNIVSELAASVAHEVRNPLTVVRGFIQLLENEESRTNREYFKLILTELDRAENIITDYLNIAKHQIEESKLISLTDQLHEVTTIMSSFASLQGVFLQVNVDENLYIIGDRTKIKQAIMNILKNGVEAIQETKGYIKIDACLEEINEKKYVKIIVKDNGVGMSKEQLERLGEPFYSLKEKGTGLGLMVTFSIIEAHKGKIEYLSDNGKGTEVHVLLPAVEVEDGDNNNTV
jgi:two-component system sporulation sensor kinase B